MSGYNITINFYVFGVDHSSNIADTEMGYFAHSSIPGEDSDFPAGMLRIPLEALTAIQQAPCVGLDQQEIEASIDFST